MPEAGRQPRRRRITTTLVYLLLLALGAGFFFSWGFMARARGWPPGPQLQALARSSLGLALQGASSEDAQAPLASWQELDDVRARLEADPTVSSTGEELEALGYASGYERAPGMSGVVFHDPEATQPGANLVVSGHGLEIKLLSMAGDLLHSWALDQPPSLAAKSETEQPALEASFDCTESGFFRRARLIADGSVLAILNCGGLVAFDRAGNVLWSAEPSAHHALDLDDDGNIVVLTRNAAVLPYMHAWRPILDDTITVLRPDGSRVRSFSILEALRTSDYAPILAKRAEYGDILHTNSIQWLDGENAEQHPAFARGNLLLSIRQLNVIVVIDPTIERVVWAWSGLFEAQHEPTLLDNGNVLVFDNRGAPDPSAGQPTGQSQVVEFDPSSGAVVWRYRGSQSIPFYSDTSGSAARLDNGNTLITESNSGRAFEVDRRGQIVWEFFNPERGGRNDELIATLFEVVRIPHDQIDWLDWLDQPDLRSR